MKESKLDQLLKVRTRKGTRVFQPDATFIKRCPVHVRRKWHDALVSGEYKQGLGSTRRNDKFCCLGVMEQEAFGGRGGPPIDGGEFPAMSDTLKRWLGKTGQEYIYNSVSTQTAIDLTICEEVGSGGAWFDASECNDDLMLSFRQIARMIYPEAYV